MSQKLQRVHGQVWRWLEKELPLVLCRLVALYVDGVVALWWACMGLAAARRGPRWACSRCVDGSLLSNDWRCSKSNVREATSNEESNRFLSP